MALIGCAPSPPPKSRRLSLGVPLATRPGHVPPLPLPPWDALPAVETGSCPGPGGQVPFAREGTWSCPSWVGLVSLQKGPQRALPCEDTAARNLEEDSRGAEPEWAGGHLAQGVQPPGPGRPASVQGEGYVTLARQLPTCPALSLCQRVSQGQSAEHYAARLEVGL